VDRKFPPIFTNRELRSALKRGIEVAPSTINQCHRTQVVSDTLMLRFLTAAMTPALTAPSGFQPKLIPSFSQTVYAVTVCLTPDL
jgi:hypothetical protein